MKPRPSKIERWLISIMPGLCRFGRRRVRRCRKMTLERAWRKATREELYRVLVRDRPAGADARRIDPRFPHRVWSVTQWAGSSMAERRRHRRTRRVSPGDAGSIPVRSTYTHNSSRIAHFASPKMMRPLLDMYHINPFYWPS